MSSVTVTITNLGSIRIRMNSKVEAYIMHTGSMNIWTLGWLAKDITTF